MVNRILKMLPSFTTLSCLVSCFKYFLGNFQLFLNCKFVHAGIANLNIPQLDRFSEKLVLSEVKLRRILVADSNWVSISLRSKKVS